MSEFEVGIKLFVEADSVKDALVKLEFVDECITNEQMDNDDILGYFIKEVVESGVSVGDIDL